MTQNTQATDQAIDVFSPYKLGPLQLPNRAGDGADDAQSRRAGRSARIARRHLLRAARQCRPDRHRRHADFAARPRLSGHARHFHSGADRRLEARDRSRPCRRRPHLRAALACGPHLASVAAARRRRAGRALGTATAGPDHDRARHAAFRHAAGTGNARDRRRRRRLSPRRRQRQSAPASTASNCTAPTAI